VERARLHAGDAERAQPGAHLARRPRRERDRQHLRGRDVPSADEVRDAVGDRARLAGARPGQHAHGAAGSGGGGALVVVQSVEHHTRHPDSRG